MDFSNSPVNKDEQIKKIIEDTEEIISNFRQISSIIVENLENKDNAMYNLGRKLVNYKEEQNNSEDNLDSDQTNVS
ncbi:MAG: hypothetical protein A2Y25_08955 [Candidatus Melainabacteria bacterium GWF2_37_15]|nr:MAG: hypothetical protein A2Y25_08955 [Candidatus Melainabacteria bacterium GWF2_37_15]